jgi:hypothetical protein
MRGFLLALVVCVSVPCAAMAQTSASFKIVESSFAAGGHPSAGAVPASAGFRVSLGVLGDPFEGRTATGASIRVGGGFPAAYPPPGEVRGLTALDKVTLSWNAEPSAGNYQVYRDELTALPGSGYGLCLQQNLPGTTLIDAEIPSRGRGFFYLVTVENRLGEEGTKGFDRKGIERTGTVCP